MCRHSFWLVLAGFFLQQADPIPGSDTNFDWLVYVSIGGLTNWFLGITVVYNCIMLNNRDTLSVTNNNGMG